MVIFHSYVSLSEGITGHATGTSRNRLRTEVPIPSIFGLIPVKFPLISFSLCPKNIKKPITKNDRCLGFPWPNEIWETEDGYMGDTSH